MEELETPPDQEELQENQGPERREAATEVSLAEPEPAEKPETENSGLQTAVEPQSVEDAEAATARDSEPVPEPVEHAEAALGAAESTESETGTAEPAAPVFMEDLLPAAEP